MSKIEFTNIGLKLIGIYYMIWGIDSVVSAIAVLWSFRGLPEMPKGVPFTSTYLSLAGPGSIVLCSILLLFLSGPISRSICKRV